MRSWFSRSLTAAALAATTVLSGCAAIDTTPINQFSDKAEASAPDYIADVGDDGSTIVALAFSGGGTRAAAWAYGALEELSTMTVDTAPYKRTLLDNVRTVSGTSGGSVMAAYLGYKGKAGYQDFRERFLYQNAESYMATDILPGTVIKSVMGGGANDRNSLARWLDENLFDQATFSAFWKPTKPVVWITASDIYNHTPFLFSGDTFDALCSDISSLKIAEAVGASAAFPVAFAPMILRTPRIDCNYHQPKWLEQVLNDKNPSIRLQAYARSLDSYQSDPKLEFIRLMDGGLTDNLGITGLTLERAKASTPYSPLSARDAVRLRNFMFIVMDAGKHDQYDWGKSALAPRLDRVLLAASNTAVSAATRSGFDAVDLALNHWQEVLVKYRCALPKTEVLKHRGTLVGWDCRDLTITTEHLSFRDADSDQFDHLNKIPTRLKLPREDVDRVIAASRQAVRENANIQAILHDTRKKAVIFDSVDAPLAYQN